MNAGGRHACGVLRHTIAQRALPGSLANSTVSIVSAVHGPTTPKDPHALESCLPCRCSHSCACGTCRSASSVPPPLCTSDGAPVSVAPRKAAHNVRLPYPSAWQATGLAHPAGGFARQISSATAAQCGLRSVHSGGSSCTCIRCSFHKASRQGSGCCVPEMRGASRAFSTIDKHQEQIDAINDRFVEARDEIETARDDAETTYFNESYTEAQKVTEEVLTMYAAVLASLSEPERAKLQRSMGLKIEQLKAEFSLLSTLHD